MKKITGFVLSCVLLLSLCACGKELSEPIPTEAPSIEKETTAAPAPAETLSKILCNQCGADCTDRVMQEGGICADCYLKNQEDQTVPTTVAPTQPMHEVPYITPVKASVSIYEGPGYDYDFVQTVEEGGSYTIVEEQYDAQGHLWGKLKSGLGWIDLDGTEQPAISTSRMPYAAELPASVAIFDAPSYDNAYLQVVGEDGSYTIVEECYDNDGHLWGKLKSGLGWVNLDEAAQEKRALIVAYRADDRALAAEHHEVILDNTEYMTKVVLRVNETVSNVRFVSLFPDETGYDVTNAHYTLPLLTPDKPLVVGVSFPGLLSIYGISFEDSNGVTRYYSLMTNNRNGDLDIHEEGAAW